jgi:hypothetical protein
VIYIFSRMALERATIESDSLVSEKYIYTIFLHPSIAEHVKFCKNQPGPSGKAKYSLMTDSELVP